MFKKYANLGKNLEAPNIDVEIEVRMKIQKPIDIVLDKELEITYYRSTMYPSITFRRINGGPLTSKETIEKIKMKNINLVLSIEQELFKPRIPLIESNKRLIKRKRIQENPIVEITEHNNEYLLEIEFNETNYTEVEHIIKQWKNPYWPPVKPMEISTTNLAKKLSNSDKWYITPKADGEHIIEYVNNEQSILIHDNGLITDKNLNECNNINPNYIYEGELMEDGTIIYFDCLMYNNKNITKLEYSERRRYLENRTKKDILLFSSVYALKKYIYEPHKIKTDGYIIGNIKDRKILYKSKFKSTVDLRYKNGYLLLENETYSERIPKDATYNFEEDKIYEFDMQMNLIKERKDKNIANFKNPYDDNPIYKIVTGEGVPTLRYYHNYIKRDMLNMLPKTTLLDIGSGKGGDFYKWHQLKFKKIYAVDAELNMREHSKKVIEIKQNIEEIYNIIDYENVSILFVPWNDKFIDIINKAKQVIIICMDKPINYKCNIYECNVNKNKIELSIPGTETSENVIEDKINYNNIFKKLENEGWKHTKLKYKMEIGTLEERKLNNMYSYHYLKKVKEVEKLHG